MIIICPHCNARLKTHDQSSRTRGKCPRCLTAFPLRPTPVGLQPEPMTGGEPAPTQPDGPEKGAVRTDTSLSNSILTSAFQAFADAEASDTEDLDVSPSLLGWLRGLPRRLVSVWKRIRDPRGGDLSLRVIMGAALGLVLALALVGASVFFLRSRPEGGSLLGGRVVLEAPLSSSEVFALGQAVGATETKSSKPGSGPFTRVAILPPVRESRSFVLPTLGKTSYSGKPDPSLIADPTLKKGAIFYFGGPEASAVSGPVFASRGPFVLESRGFRSTAASKEATMGEEGSATQSPLEVFNLREGKSAGKFAWDAPVWFPSRLGPDGLYLVGAENSADMATTRRDGTLFVWKRDQAGPSGRIRVGGSIGWLDFISENQLAVLTYRSTGPALVVWNVAEAIELFAVELPAEQFEPPTRDRFARQVVTEDTKIYAPDAWAGAISPGGRMLILGGKGALVVVSLSENRLLGTLGIPTRLGLATDPKSPNPKNAPSYRGLGFSSDGRFLMGLLQTDALWLVSWLVESGQPVGAVPLDSAAYRGAPFPGPEPMTLFLPFVEATSGRQPSVYMEGLSLGPGAVIDQATGDTVCKLEFLPIRRLDERRVLVTSDLASLPDLPLPPALKSAASDPTALSASQRAALEMARRAWRAAFAASFDRQAMRERMTEQSGTTSWLPATLGVRSKDVVFRPAPPSKWTPLPALPPVVSGLSGLANVPATRPLFAESEVAFLALAEPDEETRQRATLAVQRYDLRTGRKLGDAFVTSPSSVSQRQEFTFDPYRVPVAAALSRDGAYLAMRDPVTFAGIDVWDRHGVRVLRLIPYGPETPVQWVGWSRQGRLLSIGAGKFSCWELRDGKAVFEVDGDYRLPVAEVRGRAWLAAAAANHVDFLDTDSGQCLGRLSLKGAATSDGSDDLTISPEGSLLAYLGKPSGAGVAGADRAADHLLLSWDLRDGNPFSPAAVPSVPGRAIVAIDPQRVLIGNLVWDVSIGLGVCQFEIAAARSLTDGPVPGAPDDRLWCVLSGQNAGESRLLPANRPGFDPGPFDANVLFTRKEPLALEIDLGTAERSREFGRLQLAWLQSRGFKIGPGGWRLRVTYKVSDTGKRLPDGTVVPTALVHQVLLNPLNQEAWSFDQAHTFGNSSKYYIGNKATGKNLPADLTEPYDFGGQSGREAIVGEMLDKSAHQPIELPETLGKFENRFQSFPVTIPLKLSEPAH